MILGKIMRKSRIMISAKMREKYPVFRFSHFEDLLRFLTRRTQTAILVRRTLAVIAVTLLLSAMLSLFWTFREIALPLATGAMQDAAIPKLWQFVSLQALILGLGLGMILWVGGKLISRIESMQDSILNIKHMEGLLPICSHCKKVRLEGAERTRQDSWIAIEKYIQDHTDATFTHGLCPHCAHELYPTIFRTEQARSTQIR